MTLSRAIRVSPHEVTLWSRSLQMDPFESPTATHEFVSLVRESVDVGVSIFDILETLESPEGPDGMRIGVRHLAEILRTHIQRPLFDAEASAASRITDALEELQVGDVVTAEYLDLLPTGPGDGIAEGIDGVLRAIESDPNWRRWAAGLLRSDFEKTGGSDFGVLFSETGEGPFDPYQNLVEALEDKGAIAAGSKTAVFDTDPVPEPARTTPRRRFFEAMATLGVDAEVQLQLQLALVGSLGENARDSLLDTLELLNISGFDTEPKEKWREIIETSQKSAGTDREFWGQILSRTISSIEIQTGESHRGEPVPLYQLYDAVIANVADPLAGADVDAALEVFCNQALPIPPDVPADDPLKVAEAQRDVAEARLSTLFRRTRTESLTKALADIFATYATIDDHVADIAQKMGVLPADEPDFLAIAGGTYAESTPEAERLAAILEASTFAVNHSPDFAAEALLTNMEAETDVASRKEVLTTALADIFVMYSPVGTIDDRLAEFTQKMGIPAADEPDFLAIAEGTYAESTPEAERLDAILNASTFATNHSSDFSANAAAILATMKLAPSGAARAAASALWDLRVEPYAYILRVLLSRRELFASLISVSGLSEAVVMRISRDLTVAMSREDFEGFPAGAGFDFPSFWFLPEVHDLARKAIAQAAEVNATGSGVSIEAWEVALDPTWMMMPGAEGEEPPEILYFLPGVAEVAGRFQKILSWAELSPEFEPMFASFWPRDASPEGDDDGEGPLPAWGKWQASLFPLVTGNDVNELWRRVVEARRWRPLLERLSENATKLLSQSGGALTLAAILPVIEADVVEGEEDAHSELMVQRLAESVSQITGRKVSELISLIQQSLGRVVGVGDAAPSFDALETVLGDDSPHAVLVEAWIHIFEGLTPQSEPDPDPDPNDTPVGVLRKSDLARIMGVITSNYSIIDDQPSNRQTERLLDVINAAVSDLDSDGYDWRRRNRLEAILDIAEESARTGYSPVSLRGLVYDCELVLVNQEQGVWETVDSLTMSLMGRGETVFYSKSTEIQDRLRERRRDVLVEQILRTSSLNDPTTGLPALEPADISAALLIDVEMSACFDTSRIVEANGALQTLVNRCFLGVEQGIAVPRDTSSRWSEWDWRKRYRVWEANWKVLLYPENWLQPEFRRDKSELFSAFETELQQSELNDEVITSALTSYLEDLDELGRLEHVAMYVEKLNGVSTSTAATTLHLVARTPTQPPIHYYRQRHRGYWLPWERIDETIEAEQVIPVFYGGAFHLMWPRFTEMTVRNSAETARPDAREPAGEPTRWWKIELSWMSRRNDRWQKARTSRHFLPFPLMYPEEAFTFVPYEKDGAIEFRVLVGTHPDYNDNVRYEPRMRWWTVNSPVTHNEWQAPRRMASLTFAGDIVAAELHDVDDLKWRLDELGTSIEQSELNVSFNISPGAENLTRLFADHRMRAGRLLPNSQSSAYISTWVDDGKSVIPASTVHAYEGYPEYHVSHWSAPQFLGELLAGEELAELRGSMYPAWPSHVFERLSAGGRSSAALTAALSGYLSEVKRAYSTTHVKDLLSPGLGKLQLIALDGAVHRREAAWGEIANYRADIFDPGNYSGGWVRSNSAVETMEFYGLRGKHHLIVLFGYARSLLVGLAQWNALAEADADDGREPYEPEILQILLSPERSGEAARRLRGAFLTAAAKDTEFDIGYGYETKRAIEAGELAGGLTFGTRIAYHFGGTVVFLQGEDTESDGRPRLNTADIYGNPGASLSPGALRNSLFGTVGLQEPETIYSVSGPVAANGIPFASTLLSESSLMPVVVTSMGGPVTSYERRVHVVEIGRRRWLLEVSPISEPASPFSEEIAEPVAGTGVPATFLPMYHPQAAGLTRQLTLGVEALYHPEVQERIAWKLDNSSFNFEAEYQPNPEHNIAVAWENPYVGTNASVDSPIGEPLTFSSQFAYSNYNWEIFYHTPMYVAGRYVAAGKYEDALRWLRYIYDPRMPIASSDGETRSVWMARPLRQYSADQDATVVIPEDGTSAVDETLAQGVNATAAMISSQLNMSALQAQVQRWLDNPLDPHAIAGQRWSAYQKRAVMTTLDVLVQWGDEQFTIDTRESLIEATTLYSLAAKILGPRPAKMPSADAAGVRSYSTPTTNAELVEHAFEGQLALLDRQDYSGDRNAEAGMVPEAALPLNFCVPANDKLLEYWAVLEDRLFKLRHCQNIRGVVRDLDLLSPPIDPGALIAALAAGVDLSELVSDFEAQRPRFRFRALLRRAREIASETRGFEAAMLSAGEKRDSEALARIRVNHEATMLRNVRLQRDLELAEIERSQEGLQTARKAVQQRRDFYLNRNRRLSQETKAEDERKTSKSKTTKAKKLSLSAAFVSRLGDVTLGSSGWASPVATQTWGGSYIAGFLSGRASYLSAEANEASQEAGIQSAAAGLSRRDEEWDFQTEQANTEIERIEHQIAAMEIRRQLKEREIQIEEIRLENNRQIVDFYDEKFGNEELYEWMSGELATMHHRLYQHAYKVARRAEKAWQFEVGDKSGRYVNYGGWDARRKGLLASERLLVDLRDMEEAFYERRPRELQLTRSVSLTALNPEELLRFKRTGRCTLDLSELLFDMDNPGHYFRRIKSVAISIPCTSATLSPINCTLTQLKDSYRADAKLAAGYAGDPFGDERFQTGISGQQSIATSTANGDSGVFELEFSGEEYGPFEGTGLISSWDVWLDPQTNRVDFASISDVILHVTYTARDGGLSLRDAALEHVRSALSIPGELRAHMPVSLRNESGTAWSQFEQLASSVPEYDFEFELTAVHQPAMLRHGGGTVASATVYVLFREPVDLTATPPDPFALMIPTESAVTSVALSNPEDDNRLYSAKFEFGSSAMTAPESVGAWSVGLIDSAVGGDLSKVCDVVVVVEAVVAATSS